MILLVASWPVLRGAIRTFKSAYEIARINYRFRAKEIALTWIDSPLEHTIGPRSQ
jgi:hypothetical protein